VIQEIFPDKTILELKMKTANVGFSVGIAGTKQASKNPYV
jgi:hypothetical protein